MRYFSFSFGGLIVIEKFNKSKILAMVFTNLYFGFYFKTKQAYFKTRHLFLYLFRKTCVSFNTFMMNTYFSDHLSDNLRHLRAYHQFPQRYLAHVLKCSQYGYSKLERGQMRLTESRLLSIARLYDLSPSDLLQKSSDELIRQIIDKKEPSRKHT